MFLYTFTPLFTTSKKCKQLKCPSTGAWINKTWYIYVVTYYSATQNEVLIHIPTWINLQNIMLSETSQTQQAKYCGFIYTQYPEYANYRNGKQISGCQRLWVGGNGECTFNGYEESIWGEEKFWNR